MQKTLDKIDQLIDLNTTMGSDFTANKLREIKDEVFGMCSETDNSDKLKQETLEEAAHEMLINYGIKSMGQSIGVLEVKKLMVNFAKNKSND
jgi:hypothetical protein